MLILHSRFGETGHTNMATTIRLQRHGRKKRAFFHIVVTDSRAPRDGRFIEKLGTYNPITNPATINLELDKAVNWLMNGAQASDTAKAILSYKGALYKKHLQVGVVNGKITQEQADAKFAAWLTEKESKIQSKRDKLASNKSENKSAAMKAEQAKKEAIANKVLAKQSVLAQEAEAAVAEEVASDVEETTETIVAEETAAPEVTETPAEETATGEETPAAE